MLRRALVVALLPLGLAACGGGEDDGGDDAPLGEDEDGEPGDDDGPRWEALIRGDRFPRLVLEVDAVPGRALKDGVADDLVAGFEPLLDKPSGIAVELDGELDAVGDEHAWTLAELDALADATFDRAVDAETIKVHVLLVDGGYASGSGGTVLGVAWEHRTLALFVDTIEASCGTLLPPVVRDQGCAAAQLAIASHELGHLLGLVDNGLEMVTPHKDAEHGDHDASDACVMYWAYEGDALFDRLGDDLLGGGDGSLGFDDACLADLAAVRDR
jgi:hypothetical protein